MGLTQDYGHTYRKLELGEREVGKKTRVAVIGAGFAGLRATDVLVRHGVPVTIFEARNRVGGRVSFLFFG